MAVHNFNKGSEIRFSSDTSCSMTCLYIIFYAFCLIFVHLSPIYVLAVSGYQFQLWVSHMEQCDGLLKVFLAIVHHRICPCGHYLKFCFIAALFHQREAGSRIRCKILQHEYN